ncbi:MAG: PBP1A family penicillin-binding protein [Alphaproteobacteria bacterium]|nr:PBP1A family penicillin-binding protein [Alphaproteobacteria bacterium]
MRWLANLFSIATFGLIAVVVAAFLLYNAFSSNLPDYSMLKDYKPPILSRIYAGDGKLMATIAAEQRIFVPIDVIPKRVIDAFLSAEDKDFYIHQGIDFSGIMRAIFTNVQNMATDRRPVGASTITQQVAKNFLLTNEVSITRKVREAILATRIEEALPKDRILELYMNEIFLGRRSYGIAAAALNYFNKSLDELTVAEAAYLAALPKAPNNYHPVRNHDAALARRNWVIQRMHEDGYLSAEEMTMAQDQPLETHERDDAEYITADYYSEEVRRELVERFGEERVLEDGLAVRTSLDPAMQKIATRVLREGLISFDRRQRGWRGPVASMPSTDNWQELLPKVTHPPGSGDWPLAVVLEVKSDHVAIGLIDGETARIPWEEMSWARKELPNNSFGPAISKPADVLKTGDVVLVEEIGKEQYTLRQIPQVEGALIAMDPHTGRVYAMQGGFSTDMSQFNRAVQAYRQPGSAFKPFVYLAALDHGFTPSSLVLDALFVYNQGPGLPLWRPENYSSEFYGPTPLRVGLEKSRNVMTVRLANSIGMPIIVEYAKRFGIVDDMPTLLSFALGAKETTVERLTTAYAMLVNGGKKITPSLIDRVQDRDGKTIWRRDGLACEDCQSPGWAPQMAPPELPDMREQIADPRTAYQVVSMLEGVAQRGTAAKLRSLGKPIAGKTGTTNDSKDAWFVGFTPDLAVGVYVGFDDPKPLGSRETGSSVALPIFQGFMEDTLKDTPGTPFRVPPGIKLVRVDPHTGALASFGTEGAIWEAFIPGSEPVAGGAVSILDGSYDGTPGSATAPAAANVAGPAAPPTTGTGGLY